MHRNKITKINRFIILTGVAANCDTTASTVLQQGSNNINLQVKSLPESSGKKRTVNRNHIVKIQIKCKWLKYGV